jgi:hypothetical protein
LTSLRHTSTTLAGVALTAATLFWTAGAWVQERRVHTIGPRAFVRAGFAVIACGIGLMVCWARSTPLLVSFAVLGVVAVFGSIISVRLPRELPKSARALHNAPVQRMHE